jgi:hypothetical protein
MRWMILVAAVLAVCQTREVRAQARTGQTNGLFGSRTIGGGSSSLGSGTRIGFSLPAA